MHLLHSTRKSHIPEILEQGLKPVSKFDDLGLEMRKGVLYCWLCKEDDRMWGKRDGFVYIDVSVNQDRCMVADMEFSSLAMMYRYGSGRRPKNLEAARLMAEVYRATSVPLAQYTKGMFSTPEVLVRGKIKPMHLKPMTEG